MSLDRAATGLVPRRLIPDRVLPSIELDDQTVLVRHEVDDEGTERFLPAEFRTGQLARAQLSPEKPLDVRSIHTQLTGPAELEGTPLCRRERSVLRYPPGAEERVGVRGTPR